VCLLPLATTSERVPDLRSDCWLLALTTDRGRGAKRKAQSAKRRAPSHELLYCYCFRCCRASLRAPLARVARGVVHGVWTMAGHWPLAAAHLIWAIN
jgi:hypothetical protein